MKSRSQLLLIRHNLPFIKNGTKFFSVSFYLSDNHIDLCTSDLFGQQRENQQEVADTSRICEFLRMNTPSFTGSSVTEDPESFVEKLQKVFEVMHVIDVERVELVAYQLKGVARIWFD
ncbi:hypothetical protein MTR67_031315 [Solanum verrucosum]|uniref:Gag-pol polyprotein n=1 Tax=Solanum verrucosum TaxID=315347 RepID=A0AAF0U274_SOLVR|nr:hypothetical protein MTR67_031315 [Solanum verrucosum]